jgi:general stress protein 26
VNLCIAACGGLGSDGAIPAESHEIEAVFQFVRQKRLAVVSTVHTTGTPESALVGIAVTPKNDIVFDTLPTARKALNLAARPATALVVGWDDEISVQIEGVARTPEGDDLATVKAAYFAAWPDGRNREGLPNMTYIAVRPRWLRYSSFTGTPEIVEFTI